MPKKQPLFVLIPLMILVVTACDRAIQTVEVTKVILQTVIATQYHTATTSSPLRTVTIPVVSTELDQATPLQTTAITPLRTATPVVITTKPDQGTAYYDGIIVLAQYYTLFGQGLYKEAYQLLSSSKTQALSSEDFIKNSEMLRIISARLITAQPYNEWAKNQGFKSPQDSDLMKRFYIRVYAEGEGGMAGSVPNGIHTYFATLVWENGEWKISSMGTSP